MLGVREGTLAGWTKQLTDGEAIKEESGMEQWLATARQQANATTASADRLAAALKVMRPRPFSPPPGRKAFDALYEFIEADAQTTARGLALTYAPWVCELYKLGAYWGFSIVAHRIGVRDEPNVFAQEINHYSKRLELPDHLTQRMTRGAARDLSDQQVFVESEDTSRAIAEYWTNP